MTLLNRFELLERAEAILALPPARPWITRPVPRGDRVARFVLPLELCKTTNATRQAASWQQGKTKQDVWSIILAQAGGLQDAPVSARPQVIAIRFAPNESDPYADWAKVPIDMLRMWRQKCHKIGKRIIVTKVRGLGFIQEDSGEHVNLSQHWEPAKRGQGFVYIEVWTG